MSTELEKGLKQGPISSNELMANLARAKKVMNKVSDGNYTTGNIDESKLIDDTPQLEEYNPNEYNQSAHLDENLRNRVEKSKLPDSIKRAMIEHPMDVPNISLTENLSMDFVKGVKKLMDKDDLKKPSNTNINENRNRTNSGGNINTSELITILTPIIENIISKTIDKVLEKRLNEIKSNEKLTTINENVAIQVGESIFQGKITKIRSFKKK